MKPTETPEDRELAWIGDAALALVAREWILENRGMLDGNMHKQITSNRFLRTFGHPTLVEAELGRLFRQGGLDAVREQFVARFLPAWKSISPSLEP